MIKIDEPAMPDSMVHDLRQEVGRRAAGFRRKHRTRLGLLAAAATATAATLFVVAATGPATDIHTTQNADLSGTEQEVDSVERAAAPVVDEGKQQAPSWNEVRSAIPTPPAIGPGRPQSPPSAAALTHAKAKALFLRDFSAMYEVNADGSGLREVYRGDGYGWSWSPDGKELLFTFDGSLFAVDLRTGEKSTIFRGTTSDSAGEAAWMPDGHSVVFWRRVGLTNATFELTLLDRRTGETTRLHQSSESSSGPDVSTDGRIAFGCKESTYVARLCIIDRHGGSPSYVPNSSFYWKFSWSPDGQWIAATEFVGGTRSTGTIVFRPDGSDRRVVVVDRTTTTPAWFPDSSRVVFSLLPHDPLNPPDPGPCPTSPCESDTGVWSIRLDGSDARPITNGAKDILFDARAA